MNQNIFQKIAPMAVLLLLSSCGGSTSDETRPEYGKPNVKVEEVKIISVDQLSTFTATVEPNTVNNIASATGGRIRAIHVDVGSNVAKGQTVVTMDATNFSQQKTQLETLKRDYGRAQELYQVGGIPQQQLDQLKAQLDVTEEALKTLEENTRLISPISGVVTARNFDPGDMGTGMAILTIENINPVKVIIHVSETLYSKVFKGMPAVITLDALDGESYEGEVTLIHPTLNPISHTFAVEIEVNNADQRIRPGMFARVNLHFGTNDCPVVPDQAVLKQSGSNDRYVFVEKDGKAIHTKVELGARVDDMFEIVFGLKAGDRVIVQGNTGLVDGTEIQVVD